MNTRTQLLNPQGLLAALVAMTLSGMAIAETAGRVNFVSGGVVAVSADGSKRTLTRGDFINSGERIETNRGRAQIRFTDGSFLSLQPDTVFGVDNYTFSKAKPEEGSLLFNFVRGSMRTVSGAIGKVNRANYKVKTPVATIGIRGTGYASSYRNGLLLVSVNHGMVNLSNDAGSSNVGTGQTFQTRDGEAPGPAPEGTTVGARADGPAGEGENQLEMARNEDRDESGIRSGEQIGEDGSIGGIPIEPTTPMLADTVSGSPMYEFASPLVGNLFDTNNSRTSFLAATFNPGANTRGGLLTLFSGEGMSPLVNPATTGAAKQVNVYTGLWNGGGLSFGEWTDGTLLLRGTVAQTPTAVASTISGGSEYVLGLNQFMPYIIGTPAAGPTGNYYVEYHLSEASAARVEAGSTMSGVLNALDLGIDLQNAKLYVDRMQVTLTPSAGGNATVYNASGKGLNISLNSSGFDLTYGLMSSSQQDSACISTGCNTRISAFFTGPNGGLLGSSYSIDGAQGSSVNGVAVLGQGSSYDIRPSLTDTTDGASSGISPLYSFASPVDRADAQGQLVTLDVKADFEQNPGAKQGGLLSLVENPGSSPSNLFASGSAAFTNLMTDTNRLVAVGELTNGSLTYAGTNLGLGLTTFMPYVIGVTPSVIPDSNLKVQYSLYNPGNGSFATKPRFSDGTVIASSLDRLNLNLDLADGLIDVDMQLTTGIGPNQTVYNVLKNGISRPSLNAGNGFQLENGELKAISSGQDSRCNGTGCDTVLAGFFTGNDGDMLGVSYSIVHSPNSALGGVAVLDKTGATVIQPTFDTTGLVADDLTGQSTALFFPDALDLAEKKLTGLTRVFSQLNGGLIEATGTQGNTTQLFGRVDNAAAPEALELKHYRNTLSWARWTSPTAHVYYDTTNAVKEATGLSSSSIHYLIGEASATGPGTAIQSFTDQGLTVSYNLAGGTAPTAYQLLGNASAPVSTNGALTSGQVQINFATATASLSLGMNMPAVDSNNIPITTAISVDSKGFTGTLNGAQLTYGTLNIANNGIACTGCSGTASGFIAGSGADMVGIGYRFTADSAVSTAPVSGVAAFDHSIGSPNL